MNSSLLEFRFTRAGGPGGQNVNKVSTRVTVYYAFERDPRWDERARERIRRKLHTRISADGRLMVSSSKFRTQPRNRDAVLTRLEELMAAALHRPALRRPTRPTPASRARRLTAKRRASLRKRERRAADAD